MANTGNLKISFLTLPGEIRNQIYRDYFYKHTKPRELLSWMIRDDRAFVAYAIHWPDNHIFCIDANIEQLFNDCVKLFLTSRQIAYEAHSLFYEEVFPSICFCFWGVSRLSRVRELTPPSTFANMKGIVGLRMSGIASEEEEKGNPPITIVLDWLAGEFGYGDVKGLQREHHRQMSEEVEGEYDDGGEYHVDVTREEDDMSCFIEFDIDSFPHQVVLSGTLGKVRCLRLIEEKLKRRPMLGWSDSDPAQRYFSWGEELEQHVNYEPQIW